MNIASYWWEHNILTVRTEDDQVLKFSECTVCEFDENLDADGCMTVTFKIKPEDL